MLRSVFTARHGRLAVAFEGGTVLEAGPPDGGGVVKANNMCTEDKPTDAIDLAYSSDASMLVVATEDKHLRLYKTTSSNGTGAVVAVGAREVPKKPTSVLFAPTADGKEVLVVSDKCGDAYAAPLPDPAVALKHLLGHTAMTITSMVSLKGGKLLATGDRAEHIRVSEFPRTSIIHSYLLGHKDFVSVLAAVPGEGALLVSGGGDGMVGLWNADSGQGLSMIAVREACQELADEDASCELLAAQTLGNDDSREPAVPVAAMIHKGQKDPTSTTDFSLREKGVPSGNEAEGNDGTGQSSSTAEKPLRQPKDITGDGVGENVDIAGNGEGGFSNGRGDDGDGDGDGERDRDRERDDEGEVEVGHEEERGAKGRVFGDGVPISVSCSDDGSTVAVVVSGCLKAFRCTDCSEGPVELEGEELDDGVDVAAARTCAAINERAMVDGLVLKVAVPDDDAAEALAGGLRKHKGTRGFGKSPNGWNNFSKRRDKKQDRKRKRGPRAHKARFMAASPVVDPEPIVEAATIAT